MTVECCCYCCCDFTECTLKCKSFSIQITCAFFDIKIFHYESEKQGETNNPFDQQIDFHLRRRDEYEYGNDDDDDCVDMLMMTKNKRTKR